MVLLIVLSGVVWLAACGGTGSDDAAPTDDSGHSTTTDPAPSSTSATVMTSTTATTAATTSPTTIAAPAASYGPYPVLAEDHTWTDWSRQTSPGGGRPAVAGRRLPVRIYFPDGGSAEGPFPVFVWAHGLDATVDYFDSMLRDWAARGYVVVAPSFPLTHLGAPGGTVYDDVANQPADVSFVLDQVLAPDGPVGSHHPGLVDADLVAVGGHSLGGVTALALTGSPCCADERVRAVVSIDGEAPTFVRGAGPVARPVLLIHGDADTTFSPDRSRAVFETATGPRYLVVLRGAPHTPFRLERPAAVITATVVDFLDLELKRRPGWEERLRSSATVDGLSTIE
ncbi:MAG: hypothetical protein KF906_05480 [Actinobacteria bacterium]|nr:hypothetical protein [Actinomycetota bacterium]